MLERQSIWYVAAVAYAALWGWLVAVPSGISWHWFVEGSQWLGQDGLAVYATHPDVQIGPLSLVLVALARLLTADHALGLLQVLSMAALLPVLWALLRLSPPGRRPALALGWLVLAPAWAVLAVRWAHVDDVLALTLLAVLVGVLAGPERRGAPTLAAVALVLAVAAKPWAVVAAPLLLALPRHRYRSAGAAAVGVAAVWLPFLLGARGTTTALAPPVKVADTSLLWWTGLSTEAVVPAWVRPVQLLVGPLLALVAVLRGRWAGALLAGLALRFLVDPQNLAYYAAAAVLAALVADLGSQAGSARVPWRTLLTGAVFWQPFVADYSTRLESTTGLAHWWFANPAVVATAHAAWAVLALVDALVWLPRSVPVLRSAAGARPGSG